MLEVITTLHGLRGTARDLDKAVTLYSRAIQRDHGKEATRKLPFGPWVLCERMAEDAWYYSNKPVFNTYGCPLYYPSLAPSFVLACPLLLFHVPFCLGPGAALFGLLTSSLGLPCLVTIN